MIKAQPRSAWRGAGPKEAWGKWCKPMVLAAAGALGLLVKFPIVGLRKGGQVGPRAITLAGGIPPTQSAVVT